MVDENDILDENDPFAIYNKNLAEQKRQADILASSLIAKQQEEEELDSFDIFNSDGEKPLSEGDEHEQRNLAALSATGTNVIPIDATSPKYFRTIEEVNALLHYGTEQGASDISFQPMRVVFARIGALNIPLTQRQISEAEIDEILRIVYGDNALAEINSGYDLDMPYEVRKPSRVRFRVNITNGRPNGKNNDIQLTFRTMPSKPLDYRVLNIEDDIIDNFRPERGIVYITGPTGSGKSTLLHSLIRKLVEAEEGHEKVLEYSRPIEFVYDEIEMPTSIVHQTNVGLDLRPRDEELDTEHGGFAYGVRNSLRRAPTIIIIGEARDHATIEAAITASLTGHAVYTTMHTNSVPETIQRAIAAFPFEVRNSLAVDMMSSMRMCVSQALLPKVGGGRVACKEYMVFTPKVRDKFIRELDVNKWPDMARIMLKEQTVIGKTMIQTAKQLLLQGLIDKETFKSIAERK